MINNKDASKPQPAPAHPQPVIQIKITAMSDGNINVNGFPTSLLTTLDLIFAALKAVIIQFVKIAREGNLDDEYKIIPKKIIEQDKRLVDRAGRPLQ